MNRHDSLRAKGRGKPEGEPRLERLVQVRSLDAQRRLGEVSKTVADELIRRHLCTEKLTRSGRRQYLRLLIAEDELPRERSIASLVTTRHVQGQRTPGLERGIDYYEHRYPDSVGVTDRRRPKS
jgi:hypothetical protein